MKIKISRTDREREERYRGTDGWRGGGWAWWQLV